MRPERFPVYRKLANAHSVFRIESETVFSEVQRIGERFAAFHITAHTYPERLRIMDMLEAADGSVVPMDQAEFDVWLAKAERPV